MTRFYSIRRDAYQAGTGLTHLAQQASAYGAGTWRFCLVDRVIEFSHMAMRLDHDKKPANFVV